MNNLYWVGPRLSDILGIEHLFKGAITIFGDKKNILSKSRVYCNIKQIRVNHNDSSDKLINLFFIQELSKIIREDPFAKFLWYRGSVLPGCNDSVITNSICQNSALLTGFLSDKLRTRILFSDYVPVLASTLKFTKSCTISALKRLFHNHTEFILQEPSGTSGGYGTHFLTKQNEEQVLRKILSNDCLVSPYFSSSIPINQHLVIFQDEILSFPPSVQLMRQINNKLQYSGGDFLAIEDLPESTHKKIDTNSTNIAKIIQKLGYRGVLGIDYLLLPEGNLLFLEINSRFQASTIALNQSLLSNKFSSIQEYHIQAFTQKRPINIPNIGTPYYSIISYIQNDKSSEEIFLKELVEKSSNEKIPIQILSDGLQEGQKIKNEAFLFRLLVKTNVSSVNYEGGINHHPNIFPEIRKIQYKKDLQNLALLKFSLLTHGVRLGDYNEMSTPNLNFKEAVGKAFDLIFDNSLYINVPIFSRFISLSPFRIDLVQKNIFKLFYYNYFISNIEISYQDTLSKNRTRNGVLFYDIAQFFTDRLRIHPFPNCCFGINKNACYFCDLGNCPTAKKYNLEDIFEVISSYINSNLPIQHFLIGGGSSLRKDRWEYICLIAEFIRKRTNKGIYLMSTPPENTGVLNDLLRSGITEVGFNLELFNREMAKQLMPGKGLIDRSQYLKAFKYSTSLWGKEGNVRSLLIVGLEPIKNTLEGVKFLSKLGVMPILSAFRPLPKTPLSNFVPPDFNVLNYVWHESLKICKENKLIPGPKCVPCQNNTISLPEIFL